MRRTFIAAALAVAAAAIAAATWWWWTAPPQAPAGDLVAAARHLPSSALEALVIAKPTRAVRLVARQPAVLVPLAAACPRLLAARTRLDPFLRAAIASADGVLVLWASDTGFGIAAPMPPGARQALARLAAFEGIGCRSDGAWVIAGAGGLETGVSPAPIAAPTGPAAALVLVAGRWWSVNAARSRLAASTGAGANLPVAAAGESAFSTAQAGRWLTVVGGSSGEMNGRACLLVGARDGWALRLPDVHPSAQVTALLGRPDGDPGDGSLPWNGILGEIVGSDRDGLALASDRARLAAVRVGECGGESGRIRGAELAATLDRLGERIATIPGLGGRGGDIRRAGRAVAGVSLARWSITDRGGAVLLEW